MNGPVQAWQANDGTLHPTKQDCRAYELCKILVRHSLIAHITTTFEFLKAADEIEALFRVSDHFKDAAKALE